MVKVGVVGLGMMGITHLDAYAKRSDAQVVAVSDLNPARLVGKEKSQGNIEGQAKGKFDLNDPKVRKYTEGRDLIADPHVDLVDICLPTPMHAEYAVTALEAGKHVLLEKPLVRHHHEAAQLLAAAKNARGLAMCAMCMRFWPGWTWLKEAVTTQAYGPVRAAHFRRVSSHPGGPFYSSGELAGGAVLDLHIHDTDFVQYLFGMPQAVSSVGYSKITSEVDHIFTRYDFGASGPIVIAEGSWAMSAGFSFTMQYTVNFEKATAVFDLAQSSPLKLIEPGQPPQVVSLPSGRGYDHEIGYMLECIRTKQTPKVVTLEDAARSLQIVEAEVRSVQQNGAPVRVA